MRLGGVCLYYYNNFQGPIRDTVNNYTNYAVFTFRNSSLPLNGDVDSVRNLDRTARNDVSGAGSRRRIIRDDARQHYGWRTCHHRGEHDQAVESEPESDRSRVLRDAGGARRDGLILLLEAPHYTQGGFVQAIPNTSWDKKNPKMAFTQAGQPGSRPSAFCSSFAEVGGQPRRGGMVIVPL